MNDWPTFLAALIGAGIGFLAVWWQHHAQTWERLRLKGAELIFLGDQYYNGRFKPLRSRQEGGSNIEVQQRYLDSMEAILQYLEVVAPGKLAFAARNYVAATALSGGLTLGELGPEAAQDQYDEGRAALVKALSKSRPMRHLWWRLTKYSSRNMRPSRGGTNGSDHDI